MTGKEIKTRIEELGINKLDALFIKDDIQTLLKANKSKFEDVIDLDRLNNILIIKTINGNYLLHFEEWYK